MTEEDDLLQSVIIDQLNAEIAAQGLNMTKFARLLGKPYDSTRDYLRKEKPMRLGFFIEAANALGVTPDEIIARARRRLG